MKTAIRRLPGRARPQADPTATADHEGIVGIRTDG
jgi:hypothetical protein